MFNATVSDIGDMCISRFHSGDNQFIIMVAVYNSPNNASKKIGKSFDDLPMILSGDFNINFADDKNRNLRTTYHKPILSVLEIGDDDAGNDDGKRVVENMNES
ncbi:hypothetical protein PV325_010214 [Microctonus aethiopoides]|nr:hypothetical protein PV325_010214 [Microctonus aethiopoides]KAK0076120.1 hypothetical protein PV326_011043 [Microctonus aethiopoides]